MGRNKVLAVCAVATIVAGMTGVVGCAQPTDESTGEAATASDDGFVGQNTVYSYDAYGYLWSATAGSTGGLTTDNWASASFTGPSGHTRGMGVCLLKKYAPGTPVPCTSSSQCLNAPATLPTGGYRYCAAPNDTGQKYCYYRPGSQANYCAGSPALNYAPVAPGTYYTPSMSTGAGTYMSYACFEGCRETDPSASSDEKAIKDISNPKCGSVYC